MLEPDKKLFIISSPQRSPHGTPQYDSGLPEAGAVTVPGGESLASGLDLSCIWALWDTLPLLEADLGKPVPAGPDPSTVTDDCRKSPIMRPMSIFVQILFLNEHMYKVYYDWFLTIHNLNSYTLLCFFGGCRSNWRPRAYLIFWLSTPGREALVLGLQIGRKTI